MSQFQKNKNYFQSLIQNQLYTDPQAALTGTLDSSGSLIDDPCYGLDGGYIWVRREGGRSATRAIIGRVRSDLAGARVLTGYNKGGQLVAIEPIFDDENVSIHGAALPALSVPSVPAENANAPLPYRLLTGGRVLQGSAAPGLTVFVEAYPQAGLAADETAYSLSADVPASTGFCWSVLFIDTDGAVYSSVTAIDATAYAKENLDVATAFALALPSGVYPLAAVSLYYGQTNILYSNSRFVDLRLHHGVVGGADFNLIMTDADGSVMVDADGNVMVSAGA